MPQYYLRRLTGRERTRRADRQLARYLAFVAGAMNAGGYLAVRQYTSHMSGVVSTMADNLALGSLPLVAAGASALGAFLLGAIFTSLLVRWARRHGLHSEYALPLVVEAALLFLFGFTGRLPRTGNTETIAGLLCFTMGLQNAIVTKLSHAVIRTTHVTGMVTDIGIELGHHLERLLRGNSATETGTDPAQEGKLRLLLSLIGMFFTGGTVGALGFKHVGFFFSVPLALVLLLLAAVPILDDLRGRS